MNCACRGCPVDRIEHALSNLHDYLTIANSAAMTIDQLTRHCTFESDGTGAAVSHITDYLVTDLHKAIDAHAVAWQIVREALGFPVDDGEIRP